MKVLVTGAAGLIGGEVCARLAARGHDVIGMVRRNPEVRRNDGSPVEGIDIVAGDVTRPLIDLEPQPLDLVIHAAASLEFDAPMPKLVETNVHGTQNAICYARASGADFLHVSTAYVSGERTGLIPEKVAPMSTKFTNSYEKSKAFGELEVRGSRLCYAVARPSIVLGHSETGIIRDFPSLCNVFRLMARGKVTQFPVVEGATLNLVPIDHVAEGIVRIAEDMEAANGGFYHLVSSNPLPAAELARGVQRVPHFPDPEIVPLAEWDPETLPPTERMLAGRMIGTFGPYFTRDPRHDDAKFRALTGLECPPTDSAWLDRLIGYGIERGYLPSA